MVQIVNRKIGQNIRFYLYNGDTWKVRLDFFDLAGEKVDLTDSKVLMQIKKNATTQNYEYQLSEQDGLTVSGNSIYIDKTLEFTRTRFYYDLQITLGGAFRFSGCYGVIYVSRDISNDYTEVAGSYGVAEYEEYNVTLNMHVTPTNSYLLINDTDFFLINETDKIII